jgi:hypothetical protein
LLLLLLLLGGGGRRRQQDESEACGDERKFHVSSFLPAMRVD